jgi:Zn-dependent peptidase ImmA (M78 family)
VTSKKLSKSKLEEFARQTLKEHGLYRIPVDPVELANKLNIRVHNAKFSEPNLSGMIARRGNNVSILVNQSEPPYRKRFTIAHELGHSLLHLSSDGELVDYTTDLFRIGESDDEVKRIEVEANQFAAALLMDAELVKIQWEKTPSMETMAMIFNVSEEAMGYRIAGLGLG